MKKYCFLDLETTGFEAKNDSIIECSFIITDENLKEIERYDKVFKPDKSDLNDIVIDITGITPQELDEKGIWFEDEVTTIRDMIGDTIIVGHNIDFDITFLRENGVDVDVHNRIDTHEIARMVMLNEESYALEVLAKKYDILQENAHRAMSDVEANKDLFALQLQKIEELPSEFVVQLNEVLARYDWWKAKDLFEDIKGVSEYVKYESPKSETLQAEDLNEEWTRSIFEREKEECLIASGDRKITVERIKSVVKAYSEKGKKVMVVTPYINFFEGMPILPTPEVLLDEERLSNFENDFKITEAKELAFYIKCLYRSFLGYRGMHYFALFFHERNLWNWVCMQNLESKDFARVMEQKQAEDVLVLTPYAWGKLRGEGVLADRVMIIDEAEAVAEKLVDLPTKLVSLQPYLDSKVESVASGAHFFVADFCKNVIERITNRQIGGFPERHLLPPREKFADFVERLKAMGDDGNLAFLADKLMNPEDKMARWVSYEPHRSSMSFGFWKGEDFRSLLNDLKATEKVIFHRQGTHPQLAFWRIFWGITEYENLVDETLFPKKNLVIPKNLESSKSPKFPEFCANKIAELVKEKDKKVVTYCSSLDSLRKIGLHLKDMLEDTEFSVYGEKMAGGDGKLLQKIDGIEKLVLLAQKLYRKECLDMDFETFVVQKFPFTPPNPLMDYFEMGMKASGQSLWDSWTVPHVAARLSKHLSAYSKVNQIVCIDPAENSRWGKGVLRIAFDVWVEEE